ncbi:hypothetical protein DL93DRAFT_2162882 [Clavulina sp. PMI_390]|nr:hypothetical protein DL93DRAFT_2162882 [Clavulina sp. PMI_390]
MRRCLSSRRWLLHQNSYVCTSCSRSVSTAASIASSSSSPGASGSAAAPAPASTSSTDKHNLRSIPNVPQTLANSREYQSLLYLFDRPSHLSSPDDTWQAYSSLLQAHILDPSVIPVEIHSRALRRCLPHYTKALPGPMSEQARKSRAVASLKGWCPYQTRIDTILDNIRFSGSLPTLEDCHLVLLHNAVWGNMQGSLDLLASMKEGRRAPVPRTYELVLYSLVRKLALVKEWEVTREGIVQLVDDEFRSLMQQLKDAGIEHTPQIADHCTRIIGAIQPSTQHFSHTVAALHGVDVSQPDVIPPQFVKHYLELIQKDATRTFTSNDPRRDPYSLPPISTATLNTIVKTLGSPTNGSLTAMIGAFESLTSPLPPLRVKHEAYGYEDGLDDDEPHYVTPTPTSNTLHRSEPAQPNTQTFTYLIQYSAKLGSKVLAQNYLSRAIETEKAQEQAIATRIRDILYDGGASRTPVITLDTLRRLRHEVPRATVGVNIHMFKAIYRIADRKHDLQLMRWLLARQREVLEVKKRAILMISGMSKLLQMYGPEQSTLGEELSPYNTSQNLYDHNQHLRIQMRTAKDLDASMVWESNVLQATASQISRTQHAINRIRDSKLLQELKADAGPEDVKSLARARELREELRRKWSAALTAGQLEEIRQESAEVAEDASLFSAPLPLTVEDYSLLRAKNGNDDEYAPLLPDQHEPTTRNHSEFGDLARSLNAASFDPSSLSTTFDIPLTPDKHLPSYTEPALPRTFKLPVEDHHVHAQGRWTMRGKPVRTILPTLEAKLAASRRPTGKEKSKRRSAKPRGPSETTAGASADH